MTRHLKLQTTSIICYTDKKDTLKLDGVVVVFEGSMYTREQGNGQRGIEGKKRGTGPSQRSPGGITAGSRGAEGAAAPPGV